MYLGPNLILQYVCLQTFIRRQKHLVAGKNADVMLLFLFVLCLCPKCRHEFLPVQLSHQSSFSFEMMYMTQLMCGFRHCIPFIITNPPDVCSIIVSTLFCASIVYTIFTHRCSWHLLQLFSVLPRKFFHNLCDQ